MWRASEKATTWGKGAFFEEIADFVPRGEKVVITDMALGRARVFGGEFCEWMGRQGNVKKEMVGLMEKRGNFRGGEEGGENQVAIFTVGGEFFGS